MQKIYISMTQIDSLEVFDNADHKTDKIEYSRNNSTTTDWFHINIVPKKNKFKATIEKGLSEAFLFSVLSDSYFMYSI